MFLIHDTDDGRREPVLAALIPVWERMDFSRCPGLT